MITFRLVLLQQFRISQYNDKKKSETRILKKNGVIEYS